MCASVSLNVQLCKILTDVQIPPRGKPRAPAWEAEGLARRLKPQPNRLDVWKFCISNSWWNTWGMERKLSLLGWVGSWRMEALQRGLWGPGDLHNCCMWLTIFRLQGLKTSTTVWAEIHRCISFSPAGTQPSIWMMNQPTRLSRACCSRTELLPLLASQPAGRRRHSPDWCRCTECFSFLVFFFFCILFFIGKKKELQLRPLL